MSHIFTTTRASKLLTATLRHIRTESAGIQGFACKYLESELLRKAKFTLDGRIIDQDVLAEKAFQGFLDTEARLATLDFHHTTSRGENLPSAAVIHTARRKISGLLGEWSWSKVTAGCAFSGGSSTRLTRRNGSPANKFTGTPHVTQGCLPVWQRYLDESPVWADLLRRGLDGSFKYEVVPGSVFFTVDKSVDTRRPACKEPDINLFFQKGLGSYFRRCLKKINWDPTSSPRSGAPRWRGIDLNTQEWNSEFAFEASYTDRFSTIDLSAASDSVTMLLMYHLLPQDWFNYLSMIRSPVVKGLDGQPYYLHKVSTMGNGFTFELESLVFWAITSTVCELMRVSDRRVAIFGDDIICSSEAAPEVCWWLEYFGFIPNAKKTHIDGGFRESCGKHYYHGYDVTPFNVVNPLDSAYEVCHFINRLRQWSTRTRVDISKVVRYAYRLYGEYAFPVVPHYMGTKAGLCVDSMTDILVHGKFSMEKDPGVSKPFYQGICVKAYVMRSRPKSYPDDGRYLNWLMVNDKTFEAPEPLRGSEADTYRKRWVKVRWWKEQLDFGPLYL